MKKILLLTVFALGMLQAWAQNGGPRLVVWQKNGQKVTYDLHDEPETTFGGGILTIKTSKATIEYQLSDVLRYTYENLYDAIELTPNEHAVDLSEDGTSVTFRGLKAGSVVAVYNVGGALLEKRKANGTHPLTLSVKNRPTGVYIVKAGTETIKLMKP